MRTALRLNPPALAVARGHVRRILERKGVAFTRELVHSFYPHDPGYRRLRLQPNHMSHRAGEAYDVLADMMPEGNEPIDPLNEAANELIRQAANGEPEGGNVMDEIVEVFEDVNALPAPMEAPVLRRAVVSPVEHSSVPEGQASCITKTKVKK